jgi:ATP synthase subunit 6
MLYHSPMEQFYFAPVNSLTLYGFPFDLTVSNYFYPLFVYHLFLCFIFVTLACESGSLKGFVFAKNVSFIHILTFYLAFIQKLCESVLGPVHGSRLYPFFSSLFLFVFYLNLIGIVPYGFTVTSHFSSTFSLSCSLLLGATFLMFSRHGLRAFAFFLPIGTPCALMLIVVPVEFISFCVRFVSLPTRLFANMMSGHILLKVFVGLASTLLAVKNVGLLLSAVPLLVLILLFFLEIGVAFIQAYVFCLLMLIFLNDSYVLH